MTFLGTVTVCSYIRMVMRFQASHSWSPAFHSAAGSLAGELFCPDLGFILSNRFCCSEQASECGRRASSWVEPCTEESGQPSFLCVSRFVWVRAVRQAGDSTFP